MDTLHNIIEEVKRLMSHAQGSHGWDHVERVYRLCIRIGKKEGVDLEILKMAALLHDIGRDDEIKSGGTICHAERGAILARQILERFGVSQEKIDKVIHCIKLEPGCTIRMWKSEKLMLTAERIRPLENSA